MQPIAVPVDVCLTKLSRSQDEIKPLLLCPLNPVFVLNVGRLVVIIPLLSHLKPEALVAGDHLIVTGLEASEDRATQSLG